MQQLPSVLTSRVRVAVVGAGVAGLSVGLALCEKYGRQLDLTILADKLSPNTTSDGAGAIFIPGSDNYARGGDQSVFERESMLWSAGTFQRFQYLYGSVGGEATGLHIVPMYKAYAAESYLPSKQVQSQMFDFKIATHSEAKTIYNLNIDDKFQSVWSFSNFIVKPTTYLQWMMQRIRENGGLFVQQKVESLSDLQQYDVIVNCTGLSSRELVEDKSIFPVRGQIVAVNKPQQVVPLYYHRKVDSEESVYIIPQKDHLLLGGTSQANNWSKDIDPETTQRIFSDCLKVCPALKDCEVIGGWACLRPARDRVRLEIESSTGQLGPPVVHNYGHGGQGFILHWGCALHTVKLVQQCLKNASNLNSKL